MMASRVSIYGSIFGVLEAELMIRASIGYILDASFSAAGRISSDIQQSIQDAVVSLIQGAAEGAERGISVAQRRIRDAEVVFDLAVAALNPVIEKLEDARGAVNSFRKEIRSLRNDLCEFKSCKIRYVFVYV